MKRILLTLCLLFAGFQVMAADELGTVINKSGFSGGLIVHVDAKDISQTVTASKSGDFLIHGLYSDKAMLEKARAAIVAKGLSEKVTVSLLVDAKLPFIDNVVNVVVVESSKLQVSSEEIARVLAPRGVIFGHSKLDIRNWKLDRIGKWFAYRKPVPDSIDDWTHHLYSAGNTAVSKDLTAGPPRHMQWTADPQYCRTHDGNNSFQAMVSAGGRVFYIMDEGSKAYLSLPPKWFLTARDGFNGKILWKKLLPQHFVPQLDHLKSDIANLGHRIVAQEDAVYVTMGFNAPVSALDSRTGKELWIAPESKNAEELILYNDILYCVINTSEGYESPHPYKSLGKILSAFSAKTPRKLLALDVKTGKTLWEHVPEKTVLPLSLAAGKRGVYYHNAQGMVSLKHKTGKVQWKSEDIAHYKDLKVYSGVNSVVYGDVLLFSCGTAYSRPRSRDKKYPSWENKITALSAKNGKILWTAPHPQEGCFVTPDLMTADGVVWTAAVDWPFDPAQYDGRDPKTGKIVRKFPADPSKHMPHHRCYRNKGTDRFLMLGRTGIECFDVKTGEWTRDYWLRGTCRYGIMPANGLVNVPPNSCSCYMTAMLKGLNGLAPASKARALPATISENGRLVKGSSFGLQVSGLKSQPSSSWPMYRASVDRSGMAGTALSEKYKIAWKTPLKGKITQSVVADGTVIVSEVDRHIIYGLDEKSGKIRWSFLAGGRVNSAPSIWAGKAIFGCNDGWVYCVTVKSGELVWKYRAAPVEHSLVARENVESVWPVDGSVLILPSSDNKKAAVYCIAGRSMFLDGGLRMLALNAEDGSKIAEHVMNRYHPGTDKDIQLGAEWPPDLPAARPDLLSFSKGRIFMGIQPFSLDGKREGVNYSTRDDYPIEGREPKPMAIKPDTGDEHIFANTGFLDDKQWHRSSWLYGSDALGGCWGWPISTYVSPSGNILSMDEKNIYGYGRRIPNESRDWSMHLFGMARRPKTQNTIELKKKGFSVRGPYHDRGVHTVPLADWSRPFDYQVRALVVAKNKDSKKPNLMITVGVPEIINERDAMKLIKDEQRTGLKLEAIYKKEKATDGELGAVLSVVSTADGKVLSELKLETAPAFDGLSAANGKLFLSNTAGEVLCLQPAK